MRPTHPPCTVQVVIIGDGQVTMGSEIVKPNVKKVRRLGPDKNVIAGFAGAPPSTCPLCRRPALLPGGALPRAPLPSIAGHAPSRGHCRRLHSVRAAGVEARRALGARRAPDPTAAGAWLLKPRCLAHASQGQLQRACVELAKNWRMDKYLRRLDVRLSPTAGSAFASFFPECEALL